MFIGIGLFNLFNLLYHFSMVRSLPPTEYGHLNTLLALFMIIQVPASTVQTTITKFVSSFQARNRYDLVKGLIKHFFLLILIVALSVLIIVTLGSKFISSFLQIPSYGLVVLLGTILFFSMVVTVPWGGLQGLQKFGSMTYNLVINGGLKFGLGFLFVLFGLGVFGALSAITFSYLITTVLSFSMLWNHLRGQGGAPDPPQVSQDSNPSYISDVYRYIFPVGITMLSYNILTNIDLILVKHFFTPIEAGYYSIAQMVGKVILSIPVPIVIVMFPKISSLEGQEKKALLILKKSLMIAIVLCSVTILIGFSFPVLIIQILTGKIYSDCIPLVRFFCINMTFFSLISILLYYHLATHERRFVYPLVGLTLIQIGLIVLFHRTLIHVLLVVGTVGACLLGATLFLAFSPLRKRTGR
jgi:O-antigen/teichoic acid export membrane protein